MQDYSEMTPMKQMLLTEDTGRFIQQNISDIKSSVPTTAKSFIGSMKSSDYQADAIFSCANDPIFQLMSSPNFSNEGRSHRNNNSLLESCFKATNILASAKKHYNNNLFLTPLKEDERRKPAYFNSIFKNSPSINGHNTCRRLNFDDDSEDPCGSSLQPIQNIFEEKKGVFSSLNPSFLFTPQTQFHHGGDFFSANINASDFATAKRPHSFSSHSSPSTKKDEDGNLNSTQPQTQEDAKQESYKKPNSQKAEIKANDINKSEKGTGIIEVQEQEQRNMPTSLLIRGTSVNENAIATAQALSQTSIVGGGNAATAQPSSGTNEIGKKQKTCNCKKTKCLKLYCDCFAAGELCGTDCNCFGCFNTPTSEKRANAICNIMDRQPDAFGPKVQSNTHKKGCHCARSGCLKKYCECYTLGVNCGEYCKCSQCKNVGHIHQSKENLPKEIEELEQSSSIKKKRFFNSTSSHHQKHQEDLKSEEIEDEDEDEEEEEEEEDDEKEAVYEFKGKRDRITHSPSATSKMYTTPSKQPNLSDRRSLTTADTAKKQGHLHSEIDSERKGHQAKLALNEDTPEFNLMSKRKQPILARKSLNTRQPLSRNQKMEHGDHINNEIKKPLNRQKK